MVKNKKGMLALLLLFSGASYAEFDEDFGYFEDEFDILADADTDVWEPGKRSTCMAEPEAILNLLVAVDLPSRIQENLYLFTHPLNTRPLLDSPQFLLHLGCLPPDWQFNFWLFFNQTWTMNYTKDSTRISSYLDIFNNNLFQGLDEFIEELPVPIDIPTAQRLFNEVTVQERRAGGMFDWYKRINRFNIEYKIPLFYLERNFFVPFAVQREINELLEVEPDMTMMKLVFSDQVGIGDSRLQAGYIAIQDEVMGLNVGAQVTLPTGWGFARGLIGSDFKKDNTPSPFCFLTIGQLGLCDPDMRNIDDIQDMALGFALSAYEKLAANLLQTGMGTGHFAWGIFAEQHMQVSNKLNFKSRFALQYTFPAAESRFYITKKIPALFEQMEPFLNAGDEALMKLTFLNTQFIDTFIPKVYSTIIYPGFMVKFQAALTWDAGTNWELGTGLDLWWQDREKLGRIKALPTEIANIRTDIAVKPMAYQNKVFAMVNYYKKRKGRDWCWTLYGDWTFLKTGVGKDMNLSLHFSFDY